MTWQSLLGDRDKLCQLLEQHPKLMQMLQVVLGIYFTDFIFYLLTEEEAQEMVKFFIANESLISILSFVCIVLCACLNGQGWGLVNCLTGIRIVLIYKLNLKKCLYFLRRFRTIFIYK